jgi:hypothetical protein
MKNQTIILASLGKENEIYNDIHELSTIFTLMNFPVLLLLLYEILVEKSIIDVYKIILDL